MESASVDLAGLVVRGISVAGLRTCIEVPSWGLAFDIGTCPESACSQSRVLFTHGHVDHIGGIAHHAGTRAMRGQRPPEYFVGAELVEPVGALMDAFRRVDRSDLPCTIRGVCPGDVVPLSAKRRVVVFRSVHRVPTVGYALIEDRHALRPDLAGLPGPQIAAARARGESVRVVRTAVELAFCGDTTIDVVEREPLVRQARRLVLECTFLDDAVSVERARKTGHVHLDQLCERAELFENEVILLTHFSRRYSAAQIRWILDHRLPAVLRGRVQPLLAGF